jgi:hypothetical protein
LAVVEADDDSATEMIQKYICLSQNISSITVGAWPMFDDEAWRDFVDSYPDVVMVAGDTLQQQIDLMNMGYLNALVGKLPFEMGNVAIAKLFEAKLAYPDLTFETSFLDIINIP